MPVSDMMFEEILKHLIEWKLCSNSDWDLDDNADRASPVKKKK